MGQGLHAVLKGLKLASDWQNKAGKYAKSKIDFNQECQAYNNFGEDLQIKRIHQGKRYTSVIIGPGCDDYCSYLWNTKRASSDNNIHDFCENLITYLTDAFPLLITGKIQDVALEKAARFAHIEIADKSSVITRDDADKYQHIIENISETCATHFCSRMEHIRELLMSTIVGQQGVPIENMMMNFWRYLRRAAAIKLYENGFLNDKVPINGSITVFYENEIDYFR